MNPFDLTDPLPRGTTVLEASAGTGKTYAIAALTARYLAEGRATIGDLLLVTFSRAATAELRGRVRERIKDAAGMLRAAADGVPARTDDPVDRALLGDGSDAAERAARLEDAFRQSMERETVRRRLNQLDTDVEWQGSQQFGQTIIRSRDIWAELTRGIDLQL